jgi:predicted N-acetyltransferase YhbS
LTIRAIEREEITEFLTLMCQVFELDMRRAEDVFLREPLFDLSRKWAVFEENEMVSILTTVPVQFGWGRGFGIAGVATREDRRGKGLAGELVEHVCKVGEECGENAVYLFAKQRDLYERLGFKVVDTVIRGSLDRIEELSVPAMLDVAQVERRYDAWAEADPNRLRRDAQRWRYWRWNLRVCTEFGDGYLCSEAGVTREVVTDVKVHSPWVLPDAEWFGLSSMTERLGVPLVERRFELFLMARNAPHEPPQMYMTDQF